AESDSAAGSGNGADSDRRGRTRAYAHRRRGVGDARRVATDWRARSSVPVGSERGRDREGSTLSMWWAVEISTTTCSNDLVGVWQGGVSTCLLCRLPLRERTCAGG